MEGVIISLAILIFTAHLFSALFVKTGVPEVLPLMLLGILIGPVLNIVNPSDFGMLDQVFTRILLIVILFDSGLSLKISQIRSSWAAGFNLNAACYTAVVIVFAVLTKIILGLDWVLCIIIGAILADNSFAISIPLFSKLNISSNIKSILMVETTIGGVIAIIFTVTLINMVQANSFAPSIIVAKILYAFVVAFLVGTAAALFWTTILNRIRKLENSIFLTIAFVFVVYSVCESLGSDGAIGAFVFGIIAGNLRTLKRMKGFKFIEHFVHNVKSKSFNDVERSFFSEVLFVLRTFFFVYIGISMQLSGSFALMCGILYTVLNFAGRSVVTNFVLDKSITRIDTAVASAMIPKGLVSAVLASLLAQSGLLVTNQQLVKDIIYSTMLFSILFTTIFSALTEKGYTNKMADFLFRRHKCAIDDDACHLELAPEPAASVKKTKTAK